MAYELIGWSGTLVNPAQCLLMNPRRAISPEYAFAELLWYLGRGDNVSELLPVARQYAQFAEADGAAHGAYGARIARNCPGHDQLELVVKVLRMHPDSRQAVISLWRPDDLPHAYDLSRRDMPCTLTVQFLRRYDSLHMVVSMRSNDLWLGMPYDVFVFTSIQRLVARELGLFLGTYTHHVGSLHLYMRNQEAAIEAVSGDVSTPAPDDRYAWPLDDCLGTAELAVRKAKLIRDGVDVPVTLAGLGAMMHDAVAVTAERYGRLYHRLSPVVHRAEVNYLDHRRRSGPGGKDDAVQGPAEGDAAPA